jgi:hypothetical protein
MSLNLKAFIFSNKLEHSTEDTIKMVSLPNGSPE